MKLENLAPAKGATKARKRIGRGEGSGHGGTSTRGMNGAGQRSGYSHKIGFEGGQMPIYRRLPKRGFKNIFANVYAEVNVETLNRFEDGAEVTVESLLASSAISKAGDGVKILGNGDIKVALTVVASAFTKSAKEKIEAVGGKVEVK